MNKEHRAYNLGDLVEFYYNHQNVSRTLTGIVIEQKDSQYKIKVNKKTTGDRQTISYSYLKL